MGAAGAAMRAPAAEGVAAGAAAAGEAAVAGGADAAVEGDVDAAVDVDAGAAPDAVEPPCADGSVFVPAAAPDADAGPVPGAMTDAGADVGADPVADPVPVPPCAAGCDPAGSSATAHGSPDISSAAATTARTCRRARLGNTCVVTACVGAIRVGATAVERSAAVIVPCS